VLRNVSMAAGPVRISAPAGLLAVLLFLSGLGVAPGQISRLPSAGRLLLAGLLANIVVPLLFLLTASLTLRFWHNSEEAQQVLVGLALVAAMPVAGSSSAWAQQSDGDLALSLGLVVLSTLLCPLTTPAALLAAGATAEGGYADALTGMARAHTSSFLAGCVLLPALAGIIVRRLLGEPRSTSIRPWLKLASTAVLLTLCYANAAVALPLTLANPDYDFLAIIVLYASGLCAVAFVGGWAVGRCLGADRGQRAALMYGLGMSNNGTGLVLGTSALTGHAEALLPIVFYNLAQHVVAAAVHRLLASKI
jgi:BASS family bile acid:Na+ symporter